MRMRNGL
jgi:hypothetical protein